MVVFRSQALWVGLAAFGLGGSAVSVVAKGRIDKPSSRSVPSHAGKKRLNVVKKVTTETDDNSSIISVFLERTPSWQKPKVRFQNNFVQVELKGITVLEPGKSYPTKSPHFKKIIPYQIKPGLAALRIYLAKPAAAYKKALSCDILGERLLVYLDHSFIEAKTADALRKERLAKEADAVIATTKVRRDVPDPGLVMGKSAAKTAKKAKKAPKKLSKAALQPGPKLALKAGGKGTPVSDAVANSLNYDIPAKAAGKKAAEAKAIEAVEKKNDTKSGTTDPLPWEKNSSTAKAEGFYDQLQDKMKTVAIITVFLLMLLAGVHWYRRKMAGGGALAVQTPHGKLAIPSLKPLASYAIGPKQKLTLIGLHNKMILLGVSSDNIQYLYATDDAEDPELAGKIQENLGRNQTLQGRRAGAQAAPSIAPSIPPRGVAKPQAPAVDYSQTKSRQGAQGNLGQRAAGQSAAAPRATAQKAAAQRAYGQTAQSAGGQRATAQRAGGGVQRATAQRAGAEAQVREQAQKPQARQGATSGQPTQVPAQEPAPRQAIEDVTSLIRKKLKDLPSI